MSEMTLDRACEILDQAGAESLRWRPSEDGEWALGFANEVEDEKISKGLAVVIARKLERGVPYRHVFSGPARAAMERGDA